MANNGLQKAELPELMQNPPQESSFSMKSFEHAQRVAKMLSSSDLIPAQYKGNIQNTMIALEMANRIGASPLMVMQNLYIVQGKPSWSSTFIIAAINSCGKFSPLRFEFSGKDDSYGCMAWAYDKQSGDKLEGVKITMQMAKEEGWLNKAGSKWKTMPELMIRYRAAAFFGRLYAPEIMMGMHSAEEVQDMQAPVISAVNKEAERVALLIEDAKTEADLHELKDHVLPEQIEMFNGKLKEVQGQRKETA